MILLARSLGYAMLRALASMRRRPLIAALTVGVMTISLLLVGLSYLVERNVSKLGDEWGSGVQMIVYLDEGTSEAHAAKLSAALGGLEAVEAVNYVGPEDAYRHLQSSLGQHDELLDGIEASFLPASLEVRLSEGVRDLVSARPVIERLEATPGVEEVEFLGNWVDNVTALVGKTRRAGTWLVVLAALVGIFTVVATMRVSASARVSERRVMELMGASALFRTGPTLIEGAFLGLFGALAAMLLLWLSYQYVGPSIASALSTALGNIELRFLEPRDLAQLVVFGLSLGVIGGLLTTYANAREV